MVSAAAAFLAGMTGVLLIPQQVSPILFVICLIAFAGLTGFVVYIFLRQKLPLLIPFFFAGLLSGFLYLQQSYFPGSPVSGENQNISGIWELKVTGFPEAVSKHENFQTVYRVRAGNITLSGEYLYLLYPTQYLRVRGNLYSREWRGREFSTIYVEDKIIPEPELDIPGLPPPEEFPTVEILDPGFQPLSLISRLRFRVHLIISEIPRPEVMALMQSIILGNRSYLSYSDRESFRLTGVAHALALSGLHIGIISFALLFLFRLFMKPKFAHLLSAIVVILYMLLAGLRPSIIRAGSMFLLFHILKSFRHQTDFLHVLAFTAVAILLVNPAAVDDPGFWLSYVSTAGIYLFYERFQDWLKFTGPLAPVLSVTLGATLASAPLILFYFKGISLLSPVTNLVVLPLFSVMVCLLFSDFIFLLSGLSFLARLTETVISPLWKLTAWFTSTLSRFSFSYMEIKIFELPALLLSYLLLLSLFILLPRFRYHRQLKKLKNI